MKDYGSYLWMAYLTTLGVLLINLAIPLARYYKLARKKVKNASKKNRLLAKHRNWLEFKAND